MPRHPHWLPQLIARANKYQGAGTKFLEGHILEHVVNGRIFAEIRPFTIEEGGASSLRFSYADPPLQQMPITDDEIGAADPPGVPAGRRRMCGRIPTSSSRSFAG